MNGDGTVEDIGAKSVPQRPQEIYLLDCKARRAEDKADRMRIDLAKKMAEAVLVEGNDAVTPFLRRHMTDVMKPGEFPKQRVRAQARSEAMQ
jgi:hypothetical protein